MRHFKSCAFILAGLLAFAPGAAMAQSHYATKQAQESYDSGIALERQAEERGDNAYLEKAEKKYREAIGAEPNMVSAYIRLGYVLYALKRSTEGVQLLEDVSRRHPDNLEIKHYLGLNLYESGNIEEAEKLLTEVIQARQDLPEAYFVLGKIHLDKRDSKQAQDYFELYAAATPNDAQAYRALSSAYIQARNVAGAETALTKLIELEPDDIIAKINMGHVKYERGQIDEAVKLYEAAYEADSRRIDLLYTIASAYYLSGRYEEAITRFAAVLEKDDTHMGAQYFTADSYLKQGNLDKAEELFKALEKEMPNYRYLKLKQAYIRMKRGEPKAADEVRKLMKEAEHPDDFHFGAVMLRKQGFADESLKIHTQLRNDHPDKSIFGIYLAREYLEMKNYGEAAELLMALIDESLDNALAWEMLSFVLLQQGIDAMMQGEFETARSYFDQALSMEVHSVEAHCSFAQLSLLEGKADEAFLSFQAAEKISADHPNVVKLAAQFDIMDGEYQYAVQRLGKLETEQSSDALGGSGWYLKAVAQSSTGDWSGASQSIARAEQYGFVDSPATALVALYDAITAYSHDDFGGAEKHLARVEKHKEGLDLPDKVRYDYLRAVLNIRAKKFTIARESLVSARDGYEQLDWDSQSQMTENGKLELNFELAYVYYETGNYDGALALLKNNRSNQAKSLEGAIRRKLGYQALKNKKTNDAIENFNRLNSLGGMNASDQYNLVVAKLQSNKIQHPEETLEKFARQNIPEAVLNYAIYLDSAGDAVKATRYYEKYVSMANAKKAESVREMLETKQRVWGESE